MRTNVLNSITTQKHYITMTQNASRQWSSGNTLACGARGPGFESRCGQKFLWFSRKSLRYAAFGTGCTQTAVPRSTQPSTLRGTVNEYQTYGWVIILMAIGECLAYSSLQADSKVKFAAWPTSWRPPGADFQSEDQNELSHMASRRR